jgi:pyrroloquinoline quinone biosynthesis protein B
VASLALRDAGQVWIIDATPDVVRQVHLGTQGEHRLAGFLLTHAHMGHYSGLLHLGREALAADHLPVWAMPRLRDFLREEQPWAALIRQGHVTLEAAEGGRQLSPGLRVEPVLVPHRDEFSETVGWRIIGPAVTALWLPDIDKWERWDQSLPVVLEGVDLAYLDATFYGAGEVARDMSEIPHPFVVETLAALADRPDLRQRVRLIHLNHSNPLLDPASEASRALAQSGLVVAKEGERVALDQATGLPQGP